VIGLLTSTSGEKYPRLEGFPESLAMLISSNITVRSSRLLFSEANHEFLYRLMQRDADGRGSRRLRWFEGNHPRQGQHANTKCASFTPSWPSYGCGVRVHVIREARYCFARSLSKVFAGSEGSAAELRADARPSITRFVCLQEQCGVSGYRTNVSIMQGTKRHRAA
jgi:hypothetical protein